jgi:hypothetical protein
MDAADATRRHLPSWEHWKSTWGLPTGVGLAIGMMGAAYDRSGWLALLVIGTVLSLFAALTVTMAFVGGSQGQLSQPPNVAFWWEETWVALRASYPPRKRGLPTDKYAWMVVALGGIGFGLCIFAGEHWFGTFSHLRVLNTDPQGEEIRIRLDGKDVGPVPAFTNGDDYGNGSFSFRAGAHHVTAYGASGEVLVDRDFYASPGYDEVLTPQAAEHGVCIFVVTTTYGRHGGTRRDAIQGELGEAPHGVLLWQASSETGRADQPSTALRALHCERQAPAEK